MTHKTEITTEDFIILEVVKMKNIKYFLKKRIFADANKEFSNLSRHLTLTFTGCWRELEGLDAWFHLNFQS